MNAGSTEQTIAKRREALAQSPDSVEALVGLADSLLAAGRAQEAIEFYGAALRQMPNHAALLYALGTAEAGAEQFDEALDHLSRSLEFKETNPHAHNNLATVLLRQGDKAAAKAHFLRALELMPELDGARRAIAALETAPKGIEQLIDQGLRQISEGEFGAAKALFQNAVLQAPLLSSAWEGLGLARLGLGEREEGLSSFDEAIQLNPRGIEALYHRAVALRALGRVDEGLAACDDVLKVSPGEVRAYAARGAILLERGKIVPAVADLERALAGGRHASPSAILSALCFGYRILCNWDTDYQAARDKLLGLLAQDDAELGALVIAPFQLLPLGVPVHTLSKAARRAGAKVGAQTPAMVAVGLREASAQKLRLGYISPDFRGHSIAATIRGLVPMHDRGRFEVTGFALNETADETTRYFAGAFDHFHELAGLDHEAGAEVIRDQKIDILIDLAGHTKGNRLEILARRPAPVQVHAIGYGGPICAPYLPWRLTDPISTPSEVRHHYDETLIDMPHNALPTSRPIVDAVPLTRPQAGLPEKGAVFANFGGSYKIDPETFDAWMGILRAVPESVLAVLDFGPVVQKNLAREAEARGVAPGRLAFLPFLDAARHQGRLACVDLCLDTLVHNGGVTTTDALWAGTPVLTSYRGDRADRTGASLLRAAEMPELVAADNADYVNRAVHIAATPGVAGALREKVWANHKSAPLFDAGLYVRNLESALLDLWRRAVDNPELSQEGYGAP